MIDRRPARLRWEIAASDEPAARPDLRFGEGPQGRIFILNKRDGVIRELVADR